MAKYWIAASVMLFLVIAALAIRFLMIRKHRWSRSIVVHLIFIAVMFGLIITFRQVVHMWLDDYKFTYVTAAMINTASVFLMAVIAMQQLFQLINRLTKSQISHSNDPTTARMVARILKLVIVLVIVLLFGEHFGIGLSGLLAFGGIGGIAIGVAGKDILSNLFSGIMLYFDRPFSIGDWISSPDRNIEGTVAEIGWRITKIKTFENRPLYVPNALFSTISVENPGRMTNRRIDTTIGLRYEDAGKIARIIDDIRLMLKTNDQIDHTQTTLVYFNAFADSSLNILVYTFTKTTVWAEWLAIQQDVFLKIIDIVQTHGADFAYPTETLYMTSKQPDNNSVTSNSTA